jgi:hypothetical protein
LLPAKYQLNRAAFDKLLHQTGCDPDMIDLELPQRRLTVISQRQELPLLDLTPELKSARRSLYERSGDSLNEQGRVVAGQAVGDWIHRSFPSERLLLADLRSVK